MKKALLAILTIFGPLAYGQATEKNYVAAFPAHVRLIPGDFFKTRPPQQIDIWLNTQPKYQAQSWTTADFNIARRSSESFNPEFLSPEAVKIQMEAMKNDHRPVEGNLFVQARHAIKEGLTNQGNLYNAATYYREYGYSIDPTRAKAAFAYDHSPYRLLFAPMVNSIVRSFRTQLKYDAWHLVKRKR